MQHTKYLKYHCNTLVFYSHYYYSNEFCKYIVPELPSRCCYIKLSMSICPSLPLHKDNHPILIKLILHAQNSLNPTMQIPNLTRGTTVIQPNTSTFSKFSSSVYKKDKIKKTEQVKETERKMEVDNNNNLYKECLRNHAASLGSYATDGCGEFTVDETTTGDGGLHCAACGCHRNFHRRVTSYTFRGGVEESPPRSEGYNMITYNNNNNGNKKRYRTKFSEEQKEKMMGFAEKLGWKLQRQDNVEEDEVERFCKGIGISRKVFKVWMHNHKNSSSIPSPSNGNVSSLTQQ